MQRYFFHRADGGFDRDAEGTELPDLESARREAVLYAAETLRDRSDWVWSDGELSVEVTDVDGRPSSVSSSPPGHGTGAENDGLAPKRARRCGRPRR